MPRDVFHAVRLAWQKKMADSEDHLDENSISKSERKRRMIALQNVGEALTSLSLETLRKFDLPEPLLAALLDAKRINPNKHGGMKRQMQYIGKIMREVDAAPIVQQLESLRAPSRQQTALHHLAEQWRDRLLDDSSAAGAFVHEFCGVGDAAAVARDRVDIEALIKASVVERSKNQAPKSYRLLYKFLHQRVVKAAQQAADPT